MTNSATIASEWMIKRFIVDMTICTESENVVMIDTQH